MKKYLCLLFLSLISFVGFSQENEEYVVESQSVEESGEWWGLSFTGRCMVDVRSDMMWRYGLTMEIPLTKKIGMTYFLGFGQTRDDHFAMQCPIGICGGSVLLLASVDDDDANDYLALAAVICCLLPDGITFNYTTPNNFIIAPHFNILSFELSKDHIRPIIEIGSKIKMPISNRLFIAGDLSVLSKWDSQDINMCFGASLGFKF